MTLHKTLAVMALATLLALTATIHAGTRINDIQICTFSNYDRVQQVCLKENSSIRLPADTTEIFISSHTAAVIVAKKDNAGQWIGIGDLAVSEHPEGWTRGKY